ncbi:3D domain-containing protein [Dokdonia sp. Hel_I_53]|uniref:3D domain-containing protein n=1 Tax=Dokdonia sp. Hel_I_53 TaxID=1566287 RepID=UPI00119B7B16|nr:3D domain-containing protein [Dokdonia sp. Hel_I_53]TVZ53352.1 3D (Asp-Asp-Asp) domain-containing protein [Dokdonia sp. Hel_I_53]
MKLKNNIAKNILNCILIILISTACSSDEINESLREIADENYSEKGVETDVKNLYEKPVKKRISLDVTATAYNSFERQTKKGNPFLAAWGDILEPGERAIAVSRDLIKLGLDHNEEVEIKGLNGDYIVKDKMNKRWRKKIDIYMGLDHEAAINWGKREVEISFDTFDKPNDKFSN